LSHPHRVLIVEDDLEVIDVVSLYLGSRGFKVEGITAGEEAIARCLESLPHLILMDITLPDVDGFEVCRRLRRHPRTAHIPTIFLTKRSKRSERLAGLELGVDDYITKPFDLEELHLRIRNAVARAERENLSDPLTGLPSETVSRAQMERACDVPRCAIVLISLQYAEAFREAYGPLAFGDIRLYLARLIANAVNAIGLPREFVGCLDQDSFVVICSSSAAKAIGEHVAHSFNTNASKHYTEADRQRGYLALDEAREPFMHLAYRVFSEEAKAKLVFAMDSSIAE
jgi:DNA-binding response OmpR family regulator